MVEMLPWSLRCVAGAPQTARKKKPATPVGMTAEEKKREKQKRRELVTLGHQSPPFARRGGQRVGHL